MNTNLMGNQSKNKEKVLSVFKIWKRCNMLWAWGLQNNKGQFKIKFCC